jgi:hypothetical protein
MARLPLLPPLDVALWQPCHCKMEYYQRSKDADCYRRQHKIAQVRQIERDSGAGHYLYPGARAELHRDAP